MARRNYDPKFTGNTATANQLRPLPQFQKSRQTPVNQKEFVASLDELLRKNKGGFTAIGQETSSNLPWYVGNKAPQPTGIQENVTQASAFTPNSQGRIKNPLPELPEAPQYNFPQQIDNIGQFFDAIDQITQARPQQLDFPQYNDAQPVGSHQTGGVIYSDGTIRYADGTIVDQNGQSIVPIRSNADGSVGYSDGSSRYVTTEAQPIMSIDGNRVLYSDGSVRYGNYLYSTGQGQTPGGQLDLIRGIFGQNRDVTQQYGNYNPGIEPGSGYNMGTDIRTRDLSGDSRQLRLPVGATVVDVKYDDGTRFGEKSGHQGYGNSLLLQLPSGEMLRFSHLDQIANVKVGDRIEPGMVFGTPGQTGNTYGEHLDLEYYDANGQISNPINFSGFTDPASILPGQSTPGSIADTSDLPSYLKTPQDYQQYMNSLQNRQMSSQSNAQNGQIETPMTDMVSNAVQGAGQIAQNAGNTFANVVNKVNPTGKFDLGVTELAQGDREAAGQRINETGKMLAEKGIGTNIGNSPEGFIGAGEAVAGDLPAAGRELSATIERVNPTPRIDTGFSELLRGDVAGAKQNFQDTTSRIAARLQRMPAEIGNAIVQPAFADDGSQKKIETLGQNLSGAFDSAKQYVGEKVNEAKGVFSNAVAKPMEGVKKLKDEFQDFTDKINPFQFDPANMSGDRKLGDESGFSQNQLPSGLARDPGVKNDIRDPFFKYGGAEKFASFLNPGAADSGALSTGLFNNKFYSDPNRIAEVFGSTNMIGEATDKYKDSVRDQYGASFEQNIRDQYPESKYEGVSDYIKGIKNKVEEYLGGLKPFTTQSQVYQEYRPDATNLWTPGQNYSPYVSTAQQIAQAREQDQSNRGMTVGNVMEKALKPFQNLFSSVVTPQKIAEQIQSKAPQMSVEVPQMSFASVAKPKEKQQYSLEDYLRMGKTAAQWYAETGQQGVADSYGGAEKAKNAYFDAKSNAYRQNPTPTNASVDWKQVQQNAVDDSIMAAGQGKKYYSSSGNVIPNYSPANANMTDAGTGLPVYGGSPVSSKSNPGIFTQAASAIKRLFNF